MSCVSTLCRVEPTGTLLGTMGSLFSGDRVSLWGVNSDVTTLIADLIIPDCIWGSSNNSFTTAMLEPSGWLTEIELNLLPFV